jgi:chromate transporter
MLDGLALGETTPGPLIMVVAFVGFMGGWQSSLLAQPGNWWAAVAAALVTVWFTFLPSFGFILAGGPLVERSRGDLRIGAPLAAITAAVVGVIASLAVFFAGPVLFAAGQLQMWALAVLLLSLLALLRWRWGALQLIGAAVLLGLVRQLIG